MNAWDNVTDDGLRALPVAGLVMRISLYALVAADLRDRRPAEWADVHAALDRAVRIWKERGEPTLGEGSWNGLSDAR